MPLTTPRAGARDRIMARIRYFTLDSELALGVSPGASARLALRARRLTGSRERYRLARGIESILARTASPAGSRWPPPPVCRDRVRAAARDLDALAARLRSPGPVAARGVAQASLLLRDGRGPLYRRASREDLRARARRAAHALDAPAA